MSIRHVVSGVSSGTSCAVPSGTLAGPPLRGYEPCSHACPGSVQCPVVDIATCSAVLVRPFNRSGKLRVHPEGSSCSPPTMSVCGRHIVDATANGHSACSGYGKVTSWRGLMVTLSTLSIAVKRNWSPSPDVAPRLSATPWQTLPTVTVSLPPAPIRLAPDARSESNVWLLGAG